MVFCRWCCFWLCCTWIGVLLPLPSAGFTVGLHTKRTTGLYGDIDPDTITPTCKLANCPKRHWLHWSAEITIVNIFTKYFCYYICFHASSDLTKPIISTYLMLKVAYLAAPLCLGPKVHLLCLNEARWTSIMLQNYIPKPLLHERFHDSLIKPTKRCFRSWGLWSIGYLKWITLFSIYYSMMHR